MIVHNISMYHGNPRFLPPFLGVSYNNSYFGGVKPPFFPWVVGVQRVSSSLGPFSALTVSYSTLHSHVLHINPYLT